VPANESVTRRSGWLWPGLITLLGAFLRWHRLGDARILWDHAYPVAQGIRLLQTGVWPTLGQPTTTFLSNPPGQAYFSLLPLIIWNSFWMTFWFITTLNVLAVPLLYSLTRPSLSERTALIAAFLYAVSPWVIDFSRASWSSALLPVGCVLVLGLLLRALSPRSRRKNASMLAMFASLALLGQTYFLALVLVPIQAAVVTLARWRAIPWRGLLWGAGLFAVGLGFYGAAVAANLPAQILEARRVTQDASAHTEFTLQSVEFGLSYVTGQGYFDKVMPPGLARALEWALALAFALGLIRAAYRLALRRPGAWADGALLLWWAVPVAVLSYNNQPLYQWHLRTTLPAGQLLARSALAPGASGLAGRGRRAGPGEL
jgi:4-amino-4-deoxy-L-arabinose transferase-like glycosyltransferase